MLSSHHLQQVQHICTRVGIIVKGRLIVQGQWTARKIDLKERQRNFLLEVTGDTDGLERELQGIQGIDVAKNAPMDGLRCTEDVRAEMVSLVAGGARVASASLRRPDPRRDLPRIFPRGVSQ